MDFSLSTLKLARVALALVMGSLGACAQAAPTALWSSRPDVARWIAEQAPGLGLDPQALAATLDRARAIDAVKRLIAQRPTADRPKTWQGYRARFVEPSRISAGLRFWERHAATLQRAQTQYGVPAEVIVAIAGVETFYGRQQGSFRVLDTLMTLGFDWPPEALRDRSAFFREQLVALLKVSAAQHLDPTCWRGSYAGAIGIAQFMPSSIAAWAVDYDADGRIDLNTSADDAIGSIANFLAAHGWMADEPIALNAYLPDIDVQAWIGHELAATVAREDLAAHGITCGDPVAMDPRTPALLALVDLPTPGEPTEYRCGGANFFAITQYNRTFFYAASVMDLATALRQTRDSTGPAARKRSSTAGPMRPSGSTSSTAPAAMASLGMPKTMQLASSCAKL